MYTILFQWFQFVRGKKFRLIITLEVGFTLLLFLFVILGIVGTIEQINAKSEADYNSGTRLREASSSGFFCLLVILLVAFIVIQIIYNKTSRLVMFIVFSVCTTVMIVESIYRLVISANKGGAGLYKEDALYLFTIIPETIMFGAMLAFNWEEKFECYPPDEPKKGTYNFST